MIESPRRKSIEIVFLSGLLLLSLGGSLMRFVNLDRKTFWHDECYTALVLSGRTTAQLQAMICDKPVSFSDLAIFRTVGSASTIPNLMHCLNEDEPGHMPVFYFLELLFCKMFGSSVFNMRLVSAIMSVLMLPAILWLAFETYQSKYLSVLTLTFAALSPSLIYFAQEARDYSFGMFWTALSSAILLCALRKNEKRAWVGYSVSLVCAFYSWLFMTIVAAGHLLYMLLTQRSWKSWRPFLISAGSAAIVFCPWLLLLNQSRQSFSRAYDWIQPNMPISSLITIWLAIPYKAFAIFGLVTRRFESLLLAITLLESAALATAIRTFRSPTSLQLCIMAVWFAVFGGQDLVLGGSRSAPFRYHTLVICSMLVLFPCLLKWLWSLKSMIWKVVAVAVALFIVGSELLSDTYLLQTKIWPDKAIRMRFTYPIALRLNQEKDAVILCEEHQINLPELLDLSYEINPATRLIFRTETRPQPIPSTIKKMYLWNPSSDLEKELSLSNYSIEDNVDGLPYLKLATAPN